MDELIDDFVTYIEFVSGLWPTFVQQVRWLSHNIEWLFDPYAIRDASRP